MTEDQIAEVKARLPEYLAIITTKKGGGWICPLCGSGSHKKGTPAGSIDRKTNRYSCFSCGVTSLDTVDLIAEYEKIDKKAAFKRAGEILHIVDTPAKISTKTPHIDDKAQKAQTHAPGAENATQGNTDNEKGKDEKDYTEYYLQAHSHIKEIEYLTGRGISEAVIDRFKLGYDPNYSTWNTQEDGKNQPATWKAIIIPTGKGSYNARNIDTKAAEGNRYRKTGGSPIYNIKAVYEATKPVIITEGEIDALSVITAGGEAIALGSTTNTGRLLRELDKHRPAQPLIIALDNDKPGEKAAAELQQGLTARGIRHARANITGEAKDANQALIENKALFIQAIAEAETAAAALPIPETIATENTQDTADTKPDYKNSITKYINGQFYKDIEAYKPFRDKKTGFANLDAKAGGVYPGLYVLGAIPSLGKTTFILQLADQLAAAGEHIIYFSMEQSRFELASKSIARITAQANPQTNITSLDIRSGRITQEVIKAAEVYTKRVEDRINIIQGNYETNINTIIQEVEDYIKAYQTKPVVIIDYLQIIQGDPKARQTARDLIDENVTAIRRLCSKQSLTVIVLSSLNRSNYMTQFDYESLKESGGIEATADVVWGLQLSAISTNSIITTDKDINKKRQAIKEAKRATPRKLELVCLKNRYGKSSYSVGFNYYGANDLFLEDKHFSEDGWEDEDKIETI